MTVHDNLLKWSHELSRYLLKENIDPEGIIIALPYDAWERLVVEAPLKAMALDEPSVGPLSIRQIVIAGITFISSPVEYIDSEDGMLPWCHTCDGRRRSPSPNFGPKL